MRSPDPRPDRDPAVPPRSLTVQLFGEITVNDPSSVPIDIGGPKPRLVLVRLALAAGSAVSTESLIDTLWDDDPPPTARRSLQAHVAKLRAALGGAEGPLTSAANGYLLDIDREHVDVLRLEDDLRAARTLIETDPHRARERLRNWRDIGRSVPFADLADGRALESDRAWVTRLLDELADVEMEVAAASGDSAHAIPRLELAASTRPTHEPNWIRLITAYYRTGRQADALTAFDRAAAAMADHLGVDPSPQLRQLQMLVLQQTLDSDAGPTCPYKGLASYQLADGPHFFGRTDTVDELARLVSSQPLGVVVGLSGVGKSSVLRAGLAHRVITGAVPGLTTATIVTPGRQPLKTLYRNEGTGDLLIVDQFEELFTQCDDPAVRSAFVAELRAAADQGRQRVLIAVRSDFYGHCHEMPELGDVLGSRQVNVGGLTPAGLREAIVEPARACGLEVEPELLEELVTEVERRPGSLPLLSHALTETWRRRIDGRLTLDGYRDAGSIGGAIAATAERIHDGLTIEGRAELERLLHRLVEPGLSGAHTRRVAPRGELDAAGIDEALIARLVEARLLTAGATTIEIAHEALIAAWPRLRDWIDGERDNIALHRRLSRAAESWAEGGFDSADLYRGPRLQAALDWRGSTNPDLVEIERRFVEASVEQAEATERQRRRTSRRLRTLAWVSVTGLAVAVVASTVAIRRSSESERRRVEAETSQLAGLAAADATLSHTDRLRIAVGLDERASTPATLDLLLSSIQALPAVERVERLELTAIGGRAPSYASGLGVQVTDAALNVRILDATTQSLVDDIIEFAPLAVTTGQAGVFAVHPETARVLDVTDSAYVGPAPDLPGRPLAAALSTEVDLVAVAVSGDEAPNRATQILLVETATGATRATITVDGESVRDLQFAGSADALLAVVDERSVEVWSTGTGRSLLRTSEQPDGNSPVSTAALTLDGGGLALGRLDGSIDIWRRGDGWSRAAQERTHSAAVTWVEFDHDGERLVSSSRDGRVVVHSAVDGSPLSAPVGFGTEGRLASFFAPGTSDVITLATDGTMWLWSPEARSGLSTVTDASTAHRSHLENSPPLAIDDREVVSIGDGASSATSAPRGALSVAVGWSGSSAVVYPDRVEWRVSNTSSSPLVIDTDATDVLAVGAERFVQFDEARIQLLVHSSADPVVEAIETSPVRGVPVAVDLSPDENTLLYRTDTGAVVWHHLDRFEAGVLVERDATDAHFLSDGRALVVTPDGIAAGEILDEGPRLELLGIGSGAKAAIDLDRDLLATLDERGAVRIWELGTGQQLGTATRTVGDASRGWLAFAADGDLVVSTPAGVSRTVTNRSALHTIACSTLLTVDPTGRIPPTPRWEQLTSC